MSMIEVPEDVHKMILEKQVELYKIEGKKRNISDIAATTIRYGINDAFKLIKSNEQIAQSLTVQ